VLGLAARAAALLLLVTLLGASALRGLALSQPPGLTAFTTACEGHQGECWLGIIPGQTSVSEAERVLESAGYVEQLVGVTGVELQDRVMPYRRRDVSPACADVYFGYQIVGVRTVILYCLNLTVGDLLAAMGLPERRTSYGDLGEDWLYERMTVRLNSPWNTSLYAPVDHIRLVLDRTPYARRSAEWRGLLPRWKYCQLEPAYPAC